MIRRRTPSTAGDMRVDFVIAGTQKGGTTALRHYLLRHPEVCMTRTEEGHFFDREDLDPTPDYSDYHRLFRPRGGERVFGEKTPIYLYWYDAPRRIWTYNPDMRFVVLLRNPIARAHSHWAMERSRGNDTADFWTALRTERTRCREALPFQHRIYSYVDRGFYTEQLRRLWHYFPREQTLVLKSEELRARPEGTLAQVCDLLSLPPFPSVEPLVARTHDYPSMTQREADHLERVFEPEIRQLERLLGWDCSDWLAPT